MTLRPVFELQHLHHRHILLLAGCVFALAILTLSEWQVDLTAEGILFQFTIQKHLPMRPEPATLPLNSAPRPHRARHRLGLQVRLQALLVHEVLAVVDYFLF